MKIDPIFDVPIAETCCWAFWTPLDHPEYISGLKTIIYTKISSLSTKIVFLRNLNFWISKIQLTVVNGHFNGHFHEIISWLSLSQQGLSISFLCVENWIYKVDTILIPIPLYSLEVQLKQGPDSDQFFIKIKDWLQSENPNPLFELNVDK